MKKISILTLLVLIIASCGSTNAIKEAKKTVKGDWTLTNITYDGIGAFTSTILQDVSATCFNDSQWNFVSNNNRGTYTVVQPDCATGIRYFIWSVPGNKEMTEGEILLKRTDERYKSESNAGFKFEITDLNDTKMTWSLPTLVDGKTVYVNLNFIKTVQ